MKVFEQQQTIHRTINFLSEHVKPLYMKIPIELS